LKQISWSSSIRLPGAQEALVTELAKTGKPLVAVVMAGRPLIMRPLLEHAHAILYAWHPGSMAGPALVDLITGRAVPSGKLPVSFPRMTGQIPIYCAHKNTARPATEDGHVHIDDIEPGAFQTSVGNTSFHLDAGYTPEFPLGFGLSYARFEYSGIKLSSKTLRPGETLHVSAELTNRGGVKAEEVVQLYVRDLVGSVTRPVKELSGFERVALEPGETRTVSFALSASDLAFYDRELRWVTEPGRFHVWIGGCSDTNLQAEFELVGS
jgi:beta-glucosidase